MLSSPRPLAGETRWQVETLAPPRALGQSPSETPAPWRSVDGERAYTVQVVSPLHTDPDTCLPLLYALDGELVLAALHALPACPVRVVAISHDSDRKSGRAYDYTPPIAQRGVLHDPRVPEWRAGGADAFLSFIVDTLQPEVAEAFAVDPDCQILYGHSYGGLFVLHALSTRPHAFSAYLAASPALWWFELQASRPIQLVETLAAQSLTHAVDVVVTAGGQEAWHPVAIGADGTPASRSGGVPTLPAARGLAALLANVPGVHARFHDFPQATHHTMLAESARFALDFAAHAAASHAPSASPLSR
ncbi:alpha/beta hydrolase [Pigmentiphaga aceris]|uniref:alpha/beta hydrolase n=1 Tax=Pigmentiphaga aceris TaxID=1940612 RepID=UPI0016527DB1|nr:alpha/beta hydrolase-fold protein [Pigmentiphaga aceris]